MEWHAYWAIVETRYKGTDAANSLFGEYSIVSQQFIINNDWCQLLIWYCSPSPEIASKVENASSVLSIERVNAEGPSTLLDCRRIFWCICGCRWIFKMTRVNQLGENVVWLLFAKWIGKLDVHMSLSSATCIRLDVIRFTCLMYVLVLFTSNQLDIAVLMCGSLTEITFNNDTADYTLQPANKRTMTKQWPNKESTYCIGTSGLHSTCFLYFRWVHWHMITWVISQSVKQSNTSNSFLEKEK